MSLEPKINGINMFINKLNAEDVIINIDEMKTSFELDEGEEGFYKLSLSQKTIIGSETLNENYNRPPIGPIKNGLYCSYCSSLGPEDHANNCEFPIDDSLYLTIDGFSKYILNDINYSGDYMDIKTKIKNGNVSQEDINEILLIPDEITITDNRFNLADNKDVLTNITFFGIYKKRGPKKLASKTSTTQFLNNIIISYEKNSNKTSIRISSNGLINLINVPENQTERESMTSTLINRINATNAVNLENFNKYTPQQSNKYYIIEDKSYIHSISGQFTIKSLEASKLNINFEELDNLISPYNNRGKIINSEYTTVETTEKGDQIIIFDNVRIIEWLYSMGKLTRNQVMSKEYVKFITIPDNGVKLTGIINKSGIVMLTLSFCSDKQMSKGLCGRGLNSLNKNMFNGVISAFNNLFEKEYKLLTKKTLDESAKISSGFNTVTGYAPSGKICRLTRTRDFGDDDKKYKEGTRPFPYSWKGNCPDPNYQYLKPEGVQDTNTNLWYPCCDTKTIAYKQYIRDYLINGFPRNKEEAKKYNIKDGIDLGSGILIPDSNIEGASAEVFIDGKLEEVTIIKKLSKKSNDFKVRRQDMSIATVYGTDFLRDSRVFPGLKDFNREQLLNCIRKSIKLSDLDIDTSGNLVKNNTSHLNETYKKDRDDTINSLIDTKFIKYNPFNVKNINYFKVEDYSVRKVPLNSYQFYLVLGPTGNFYINEKLETKDSDISKYFESYIVLNGYVRFNDTELKNEYNVVDILYYKKTLTTMNYLDRYNVLLRVQTLMLTEIFDEILIFPDIYDNIIEGSYSILQDKSQLYSLVFISENSGRYIVWDIKDPYNDVVQLQILSKNKKEIKFGYDGKSFVEYKQINFLDSYDSFNKRDIPEDVYVNDYFNIKINRDADGDVVPVRKLSILNKTQRNNNYDNTVNVLLNKFNPIGKEFFNSPEEWITNDEILTYDGEKLVINN